MDPQGIPVNQGEISDDQTGDDSVELERRETVDLIGPAQDNLRKRLISLVKGKYRNLDNDVAARMCGYYLGFLNNVPDNIKNFRLSKRNGYDAEADKRGEAETKNFEFAIHSWFLERHNQNWKLSDPRYNAYLQSGVGPEVGKMIDSYFGGSFEAIVAEVIRANWQINESDSAVIASSFPGQKTDIAPNSHETQIVVSDFLGAELNNPDPEKNPDIIDDSDSNNIIMGTIDHTYDRDGESDGSYSTRYKCASKGAELIKVVSHPKDQGHGGETFLLRREK